MPGKDDLRINGISWHKWRCRTVHEDVIARTGNNMLTLCGHVPSSSPLGRAIEQTITQFHLPGAQFGQRHPTDDGSITTELDKGLRALVLRARSVEDIVALLWQIRELANRLNPTLGLIPTPSSSRVAQASASA